jgi:hypothetical protein
MSYKFIIDTNVLDEESAKRLRDGGIIDACSSGRFAFYVTPILLKERFDFASKGKIPCSAIAPIKLLAELKWQRLFNEPGGPEGIYTKELEGKPRTDYLFRDYQPIKNALMIFLNGGEFTDEEKKIIAEDAKRWSAEKKANKAAYKAMRQDVTKKLQINKSFSRKGSNFKSFLETNFESTAIDRIQLSINSTIPKEKLVEYWRKNRARCPYFNKFVEGGLFTAWYFMAVEQEPKIDPNAYEDIEHLVYLVGLDGIVSNEKGFMKTACKALYPDKDFLSVEQFISRLKR